MRIYGANRCVRAEVCVHVGRTQDCVQRACCHLDLHHVSAERTNFKALAPHAQSLHAYGMKFFVPHATDPEQAEGVWISVKAFLAQQGLATTDARIYEIAFRHNGKNYRAVVGERFADLNEDVIAIYEGVNLRLYYLCTATRGVVRGEPYLIGRDAHSTTKMFESDSWKQV